MSPDEVRSLLSYASSVDQWLKASDPGMASAMVEGWASLLGDVPADFAMRVARTHYAQGGARTLQPGDVAAAWAERRREAQQRTDEVEVRALAAAAQEALPVGAGASAYLRDLAAAAAAGRDLSTVPRPATVRVLPHDADVRGRRCVYHALCACDHEHCRDGWADDEARVVNALGRSYPAAQRCLHCQDALIMAEERGVARKPSRTAARR